MRWIIATKTFPEIWFAWHPVKIGKQRVWWEWVYRTWHQACDQGFYEYAFTKQELSRTKELP